MFLLSFQAQYVSKINEPYLTRSYFYVSVRFDPLVPLQIGKKEKGMAFNSMFSLNTLN